MGRGEGVAGAGGGDSQGDVKRLINLFAWNGENKSVVCRGCRIRSLAIQVCQEQEPKGRGKKGSGVSVRGQRTLVMGRPRKRQKGEVEGNKELDRIFLHTLMDVNIMELFNICYCYMYRS